MAQRDLPSREELEQLYQTHGKEALVWYAWRNALRVLPLLARTPLREIWTEGAVKHSFAVCRVSLLLATGGGRPEMAAAAAAADAAAYAAAAADASAADAAAYAASAASAADAAASAYAAYAASASADAARADFEQLVQSGIQANDWLTTPLWRKDKPESIKQYEAILLKELTNVQLEFLAEDIQRVWQGEPIERQRLSNYAQDLDDEVLNDPAALKEAITGNSTQKPALDDLEEPVRTIIPNITAKQFDINGESISDTDHLGRKQLVDALAKLLSHPEQSGPLTIGLLGDWGSGKSTTITLLKNRLKEGKNSPLGLHYHFQEFNAWSYEHTDNIQAGVAQEAVSGLTDVYSGFDFDVGVKSEENMSGWRKVQNKVKYGYKRVALAFKLNHRINGFRLYGSLGFWLICMAFILFLTINGRLDTVWGIGLSTTLSILFFFQAMKHFLAHPFAKELYTYLNLPDYSKSMGQLPVFQQHVKTLAEISLTDNRRMVFVVDDLDRCSPEGIVKVFEAVRLVMDLERVVVIIAIDHRIALAALAHHYKELVFDKAEVDDYVFCNKYEIARDYLGKIIQLPVNLEAPDQESVDTYIDRLFKGVIVDDKQQPEDTDFSNDSVSEVNVGSVVNTHSGGDTNIAERKVAGETDNEPEPESNEVQDENSTMLHLPEEREHFRQLIHDLDFQNPRQIKRLHSSYRLLRAYRDEGTEKNLENMKALFWYEFEYSHSVREIQEKKNGLNENDQYSSVLNSVEKPGSAYQFVRSFVLPSIGSVLDDNTQSD